MFVYKFTCGHRKIIVPLVVALLMKIYFSMTTREIIKKNNIHRKATSICYIIIVNILFCYHIITYAVIWAV